MNTETVAHAYIACVELDDRARAEYPALAENLSTLRADLHALLMDALRQAKIPFSDRSDAARIAFDLVRSHSKAV